MTYTDEQRELQNLAESEEIRRICGLENINTCVKHINTENENGFNTEKKNGKTN